MNVHLSKKKKRVSTNKIPDQRVNEQDTQTMRNSLQKKKEKIKTLKLKTNSLETEYLRHLRVCSQQEPTA